MDGLSQAGVGLDVLLFDLLAHPLVQPLQHWLAVLLVEAQSLCIGKMALLSLGLIMINLAQALDHLAALLRKARHHVHKMAPTVAQAVAEDRLKLLGFIAGQRVTHVKGLAQRPRPTFEQSVEVFPGMVLPGKE